MKQLFIFIPMSIILIGCGGESSHDRVMDIGESYSVSSGNKVVKTSEDTLIKITHIGGQEESTVSLLEGNATILAK